MKTTFDLKHEDLAVYESLPAHCVDVQVSTNPGWDCKQVADQPSRTHYDSLTIRVPLVARR